MRIGIKEVVVLADFMRLFVGDKMEVSAHPELPSPPPIVAPQRKFLREGEFMKLYTINLCF